MGMAEGIATAQAQSRGEGAQVLRAGVPEISVVMPCYNAEAFLREAVDSIIAQDFPDWELIAVNDGSKDETGRILREYAAKDSRIRVVEQENQGISRALNNGINAAKTGLIARMDADDISMPDRLRKQKAYMDGHARCVALGSAYWEIDDQGAERVAPKSLPVPQTLFPFGLYERAIWLAHPSVMMRTAALISAGLYDPAYDNAEDLDLWRRLRRLGEISKHPERLLKFRTHHLGRSSTQGLTKQIDPHVKVIADYQSEFLDPLRERLPEGYEKLLISAEQRKALFLLRRFATPSVVYAGCRLTAKDLAALAATIDGLFEFQQHYRFGRVRIVAPALRWMMSPIGHEFRLFKSSPIAALGQIAASLHALPKRSIVGLAKQAVSRLAERWSTFEKLRRERIKLVAYPISPVATLKLDDLAFDSQYQRSSVSFVQQTFHVLPKLGLLFAECSKNGCTSLKAHLGMLEIGTNQRLQQRFLRTGFHGKLRSPFLGVDDIGPGNFTSFAVDPKTYRFCMSRNPYARVFSAYNDKIAGIGKQKRVEFAEYRKVCEDIAKHTGRKIALKPGVKAAPVSFDEFLSYLSGNSGRPFDRHWHHQWKTMRPDVVKYDQIGKIEEFEQEFAVLMLNLGVHEKFWFHELLQQNRHGKRDWREHYDESRAGVVYRLYEEDFDWFGYSRESWRK